MKRFLYNATWTLGFGISGFAFAGEAPKTDISPRVSLSVREADLRDILRAASRGTNFNISFEPGIDTLIQGVDLKGVTLEEMLEQILPVYGLTYTKQGRSLAIRKSGGGAPRFYQVDSLAMRRTGVKSFHVNASGQAMQGGGNSGAASGSSGSSGGNSGVNSSAYTSSIQVGNESDPWQELEYGLSTIIFGEIAGGTAAGGTAPATSLGGPKSRGFVKGGKSLLIQPDAGMVMVVAEEIIQQRVDAYLKEIKRRNSRQVIIEARIVEVSLSGGSEIGVDWNVFLKRGLSSVSGALGSALPVSSVPPSIENVNATEHLGSGAGRLIVRGANVQAALSALAKEGRLKVLSAPRISTMNNQKAIWRVVQENAYFTQNSQITPGGTSGNISSTNVTTMVVPVGIILDILPQISEDGSILLAVSPSVSQVSRVKTFPETASSTATASASMPEINRRDLDAVVRIRSGETLVLAGIIQTSDSEADQGVPWLRKIPMIGHLFSYKSRKKEQTELAIFITPTLMEQDDQIAAERQKVSDRLEKAGAVLNPQPVAALPPGKL